MEVSGGDDHVPRRHVDGVCLAYPAAAVDGRFAAVTGAQIGRAVVALTAGVARGVGCRAFATGRPAAAAVPVPATSSGLWWPSP